jgi:hypothetical protein
MSVFAKLLSVSMLGLAMNGYAQAPATDPSEPKPVRPKATPQSEAGEPRANTSQPGTAQSEAGEPRANTSKPGTAQSEAGEPRANTSRPPATAARPAAGAPGQKAPGAATAGATTPGAADKLQLGTATVTGDREQPKVMYIVPWKRSDIGDLAGKPMNSLVDEILSPVDRDVFKREVVYYKAVQAEASQNGAPGHPSEQVEK